MTRVPIAMLGLAAWLFAGLGLRAWLGGKAYLAAIFGDEALADRAWVHVLDQPEALLLGVDPWTLLLAFSVAVAAALVLVVLWPWDLLLARIGIGRRRRVIVGVTLGALTAGIALWSVHPLLALPSVPEGPRTVLNYACEAAGYGWINTIAYLGAIVTGGAFAWANDGTRSADPEPDGDEAEDESDDDEGHPDDVAPSSDAHSKVRR